MARVALVVCALLASDTVAFGRTAARPASPAAQYRALDITPHGNRSYQPASINVKGEVVGRSWGTTTHPFAYVGSRVHDLGVPTGSVNAAAISVSASGTILVKAWPAPRHPRGARFYALLSSGRGWTWHRLRAPAGLVVANLSGIAGNGDIAGYAWTTNGQNGPFPLLWAPGQHHGYGRARRLPISKKRTATANAIWSDGPVTVVVGVQGRPQSSNTLPTVWRLGARDQVKTWVRPDYLAPSTLAPNTMGGSRGHVYVAGGAAATSPDTDSVYAVIAPVHIPPHGAASVGDEHCVDRCQISQSIDAIVAGPGGSSVAVGKADINGRSAAEIYHGLAASRLRKYVGAGFHHPLAEAEGINPAGEIAASGPVGNRTHAYVLKPVH